MSAPFLMWYDDNPKLSIARKIEDAIGAYRSRWPSSAPTLVLVNEAEVTEVAGVEVRGVTTVRRNNVWVGLDNAHLDQERRETAAKDVNAKVASAARVAKVVNAVSAAPLAKPRRRKVEAS